MPEPHFTLALSDIHVYIHRPMKWHITMALANEQDEEFGGAGVLELLEGIAPATLRSGRFWLAMALTYVPFLAANGVLTGLPVVWYDDARILSIRAGSIPLEDFVYSFSMLAMAAAVHDAAGRRRRRP